MPPSEEDTGSKLISVASALSALDFDEVEKDYKVEGLSGGLTNDNVLVTFNHAGRKIVLRRFLSKTSIHLRYNRQHENDNSRIAADEKKIGAPVLGYISATASHGGALAVEFIKGKTLDEIQIRSMCSTESGINRLVDALRKIHAEPSVFRNSFDPFKARVQYEKEVQVLTGSKIQWKGYTNVVKKLGPIQALLDGSRESQVDCHNDLLGANFIDSEGKLTIIDWELSGQAEPSWELGNFISENGLDGPKYDTIVASIITRYWEEKNPSFIKSKTKRARLFSLVSKVTWAAWGAVLDNLDKEEAFDYKQWSMLRLQRASLLLDDQGEIDKLCTDQHLQPD